MRVLVVSTEFPPEPRELLLELAQAFQSGGHQVQVVTGFPNWPKGELYPGYKMRLCRRDVVGGVPTVRIPTYPNHDPKGLKRMLNMASLSISLFFLGPFTLKRAEHIHVVNIPLLVISARWLAFFWGARVTMEVQDLWPDTFAATRSLSSGKMLRLVGWITNVAYRKCVMVRVISEGFASELRKRGVPSRKIRVIPNWIDDEANKPVPAGTAWDGPALPEGFRILYAGSMGRAQALSVVLDAAPLLKDRPDIQFLFAGDGVERKELEARAAAEGLENVRFLGSFPQKQMANLYAQVDVLLVHLSADPLWHITIPSKIVTCLAYQKPILAGLAGDAKRVVDESQSGLTFEPGNAQALNEAARRLADMDPADRDELGKAGRQAAENQFSFRVASKSLLAMLDDCH